jgi:DNA primase
VPRISDADVVRVRERTAIDQVVGETVTLRRAGGGSLKGLCPFHDEKSPSFTVRPEMGVFHCFGCGKSGDVITFVREVEALSFVEAVERLAARAGVTLTYEQTGPGAGRQQGERQRLLAAHAEAEAYFRSQLGGDEAAGARAFLTGRGFDESTWERFGVGYAPNSWDKLTNHLQRKGFRAAELVTGGLAREGRSGRGPYDAFRGRLLWPIRSRAGETIGFGARRLREDDEGPKYLNTGETPLYKKAQVLYGLDLARKDIALRHQAVIVEGYTDVMAAHLAGVPTAVATCGTAFGGEHADVLRRVLLDQEETPGEVIFTFDGDDAGQKAALKAFGLEERFVAQTFVAIGPGGLDPCDLRLQHGDAAVRDLVASRVPLFTFVLRTSIDRFDLNTPDGRVEALKAAAPVLAKIRDRSLRPEYVRTVAGWLGMDIEAVADRVAREGGEGSRRAARPPVVRGDREAEAADSVEREALKLAVQRPALAAPVFDALAPSMFLGAVHRSLRETIAAVGGTASTDGGRAWVATLNDAATADDVRSLVHALAVEPVLYVGEDEPSYVRAVLARVEEIAVTRQLVEVKGRLQRTDPGDNSYLTLFSQVLSLEGRKRSLRDVAVGSVS